MIADRIGMKLTKTGRTIKRLGGVYSHKLSTVKLQIMPDLISTSKRSERTGCVGRIIDHSVKKSCGLRRANTDVFRVPLLRCYLWLAILFHISRSVFKTWFFGTASFSRSRPATEQTSQTKCNITKEFVKQLGSKST